MKKFLIATGVIIVILIFVFIYRQAHISITGFNIPKDDLTDVLIYTEEHQYMVTDSAQVLDLSKEVSKMKKLSKIDASNYPLSKKQPSKFLKIEIQTKNKGTIGGAFWVDGGNVVLDSNGYYWTVTQDSFDLMEKSLKYAKVIN